MTDEEIRERAKIFILDACQKTGFSEFSKNHSVKILELETGEIEFCFDYSLVTAKGSVRYSPQPFIEGYLKDVNLKIKKYEVETDYFPYLLTDFRY